MKELKSSDPDFYQQLKSRLSYTAAEDTAITATVADICRDVELKGDRALLEYTERFDHIKADAVAELTLTPAELKAAFDGLDSAVRDALRAAAARILAYHQKQKQSSWHYQDELGNTLGQKVTPITRVGIYVPGGKAAYPSTVLMNAIPAAVAGVKEIIMVVPAPNNEKNQAVLAAAYLAGVTKVITVGGAQAIAALAYGTESIAAVDKITGPGNAYVAAAKKHVYGLVGIDMIAGPSEILIISDGTTNPEWLALDLFSQSEHDELAQAILISPDARHLKEVAAAMEKLLPEEPRKKIISTSWANRGAMIQSADLDDACAIANFIAPEHLELSVADPDALVDKIHNAGAIFLGKNTTESFGDYCAGPNHTLPTSRTARFASPLGVYDFQKKTSIIKIAPNATATLGRVASTLAREEGLIAHAEAAEIRMPVETKAKKE